MFYGTIKQIFSERGFGFIGTEGKDVYFHAAEIGDDVFKRLKPEQPVVFEYAPRDRDAEPGEQKGPRAGKLKLIDRIPGGKLEQDPQHLAPRHHPRAKQRKATWKRKIDVQNKRPEEKD
jgi:cold shock CspA family protein